MLNQDVATEFASAARADRETIISQNNLVANVPMLHQLVNLVADSFLILNAHRQIIFCNQAFLRLVNIPRAEDVYGLRPGEVLNCIYSHGPGGCGTSAHCAYCGAVNSILNSQRSPEQLVRDDCVIICGRNKALNLHVRVRNLTIKGDNYTVFVARDIGDRKRREMLEHALFSSVGEALDGLHSLADLLALADGTELERMIGIVKSVTEALTDEVKLQRALLYAEAGKLQVTRERLNSGEIVRGVYDKYVKYDQEMADRIAIDEDTVEIELYSDGELISRIIGLMVDNALEAVFSAYPVTIGARAVDGMVEFWVHNWETMSRGAQMQLFKRYFSSKSDGRGIGTYAMKLLGENYLGGKVTFTSEAGVGTTFALRLPLPGRIDLQ